MPDLDVPAHLAAHLSPARAAALHALADRNDADHGEGLLGLVLSGSAGRGLATERSDLDVLVVLSDEAAAGRRTTRTPEVDEVPTTPTTLDELAELPPFGSDGWWYRWSLAWAPVLLDRTGGALPDLVRRHATLAPDEQREVLITHDRLDGYVNYAYRALKNDRDDRALERAVHAHPAAEELTALLDGWGDQLALLRVS